MVLSIEKKDNRFRVKTQQFSTCFLPDTPDNRKISVVFLRLLEDGGKPLFTLQQLSGIVESNNRQASSQHVEDFRDCGLDFKSLLTRQRKVSEAVVTAVRDELMSDPLATISELTELANKRLSRTDLSDANITAALEQIPSSLLRTAVKREIEKGQARYKEEALISQMLSELSDIKAKRAGIADKSEGSVAYPDTVRALVEPNLDPKDIPSELRLSVLCLSLYYWGVPLSRLGQWFSCHKTTILRHLIGLVLPLWAIIEKSILDNVKANCVHIDEKWLKIKGKWHYWFVVLDKETEIPVLSSLLCTRTKSACKFIAFKLKALGKVPSVYITDGLSSYKKIFNKAKHQICIFHHQKGVSRFLKEKFETDAKATEMKERKKEMKQVFQTEDKRTVTRRLSRLETNAEKLGIAEWVARTKDNLSNLISTIGSKRVPKTNNAIERFFRQFNRFYKTRCGFFSIKSARNQLILFMVVYLFTKNMETQKAPIEAILPSAPSMPLYKILNDPFSVILDSNSVKMADFSHKERLLE
jgi:transposase-like protein